MRVALLLAALIACSSCSVIEQPSGLIPRWTTAWKEVVSQDDRQRLADWRKSFLDALTAAKSEHCLTLTRASVRRQFRTASFVAESSRSAPRIRAASPT
jgi:hypothetical protein